MQDRFLFCSGITPAGAGVYYGMLEMDPMLAGHKVHWPQDSLFFVWVLFLPYLIVLKDHSYSAREIIEDAGD